MPYYGRSKAYSYWPMGTVLPPEDQVPADQAPVENGIDEIDLDTPPVEEEEGTEEITTETWMFPSTVAQQIFSIVPGIAGGLAGFILALKLANTKKVNAGQVMLASGLVAMITFASIFLIKTVDEE